MIIISCVSPPPGPLKFQKQKPRLNSKTKIGDLENVSEEHNAGKSPREEGKTTQQAHIHHSLPRKFALRFWKAAKMFMLMFMDFLSPQDLADVKGGPKCCVERTAQN